MREIQANIDRPMALQNYLRRTFPSIPPAILRKALENRDVRRRGTRLYPDELVYPDDEIDPLHRRPLPGRRRAPGHRL